MISVAAIALVLVLQLKNEESAAPLGDQEITVDQSLVELVEKGGMSVPKTIHAISVDDIWQTSPYCGVNSLYVLLKLNDVPVNYSDLKKDVPTASNGASLLNLQGSAERYGLATEVVSIGPSEVGRVTLPAIALLGARLNQAVNGHYVVVLTESDAEITAIDGTTGNLDRISKSQFNRAFSGYVLVKKGSVLVGPLGYSGTEIAMIVGCVVNLIAIGALLAGRPSERRIRCHS